MIGYVGTGQSFIGCIKYDLEDKQELTEEAKEQLSLQDGLQHKDRAEVLAYNKCFGDKYELAEQFREVARLSKRVEKPVFHFSLRLAPGETCTSNQLVEMGEACAKEFGVGDNQYLIILHKDTNEQHIHIVANRVGFDSKVASDSNSYRRMAALCRRLEKEYKLKEVLSPRAFLSKEQRLIPRHDTRKEQLKTNIRATLKQVNNYQQFVSQMQALGYKVIKGRGITFVDNKKVKIKGSEVGFSLAKIEQILKLKHHLVVNEEQLKKYETKVSRDEATPVFSHHHTPRLLLKNRENAQQEIVSELKNQLNSLLDELLKTEYTDQSINPELLKEAKRKRKRQKRN
jgi:hypothetical protein